MRPGLAARPPQGSLPQFQVETRDSPRHFSWPLAAAPEHSWLSVKDPGPRMLLLALWMDSRSVLQQVWLLWGPQVWLPPFLAHGMDEALCFVGVCMVHKGATLMMSHFIFTIGLEVYFTVSPFCG